MSATTATPDYKSLAAKAANNHAKFDSFAWHAEPADSENWALIYTDNRDSNTIDRANAQEITKALARFPRHAIAETHNHWACGHVNGFALRVYDSRGRITSAFKAYCDLQAALSDYPVLDDETLSAIESEEIDDAWDSWLARDFQKALDSEFSELLGGMEFDIPSEQCRALFDKACSDASHYPEHTGSEVICKVERIAAEVTCEQVREFAPVTGVKLFRNGVWLVNGCQQLDVVTCDYDLLTPELLACVTAHDSGETSLDIGGDVFTWEIE